MTKMNDTLRPRDAKRTPNWTDVWPQTLASTIALSCSIQVGISNGYPALLIPQLVDDPQMTGIDKDSLSWVASLFSIAYAAGGLFLPVMDVLGRRNTIIIGNVPFLISWALMYMTKHSIWTIYLARIFCGIAAAPVSATTVVYVAEIMHAEFRGSLLSGISFFSSLGILLSAVLGSFLEWHTASLVFGCISVVNLLTALLLPESPYWQASFTSMNTEKLVKSVRYLNRRDSLFDEAWLQIEQTRQSKQKQDTKGNARNRLNVIEALRDRKTFMPLILTSVLLISSMLTGFYTVFRYPVNIFESCCGNLSVTINSYSAVIVMNSIRVILTFVAAWIAKVIGRRPMLIISCSVMAISSTIAAIFMWFNNVTTIYFTSKPFSVIETDIIYSYIILFAMIALLIGSGLGLTTLPWTLTSELLPTESKGLGSTFINVFGSVLTFVVVKTFPYVVDFLTLPGLFVFQAAVAAATVVFVHLYLPETFRKNFNEISEHFENPIPSKPVRKPQFKLPACHSTP